MIPPPRLQIYLRLVMLIFDLRPPKLITSCPCPVHHLCQLASTVQNRLKILKYCMHKTSLSKQRVHEFG